MIHKPKTMRLEELLDCKKRQLLTSNPEYQRGVVWSKPQKKRLIDSVLRKYPLPLIYLHRIAEQVESLGIHREVFEIIDGQQRIDALHQFFNNAFKLFDPVKDEKAAQFPSFIKEMPCTWAGRLFRDLEKEDSLCFLNTELAVVVIETNNKNEARDLFIRLQAGMPLNAQEKRDAWPGNFTDFVLRIGGKFELEDYPGHDFFQGAAIKPRKTSRGDNRQLASQMFMLLSAYIQSEGQRLCGIDRHSIDQFYYEHLDFDHTADLPQRFVAILDNLSATCEPIKKKLAGHEAIHLMLLATSLPDGEMADFLSKLPAALEVFRSRVAAHRKVRRGEYWVEYGQLTQTGSHSEDIILRRHLFFTGRMRELLGSSQPVE